MGYDDSKYQSRKAIVVGEVGGFSVGGTNAADAEITRIRMSRAVTISDIDLVACTGGTAAGPSLLFGKSLAGTGAVANFCTQAFGTHANNAGFGCTVTSTDFADGDHLVISKAAGTAASTPKVTANISWRETF